MLLPIAYIYKYRRHIQLNMIFDLNVDNDNGAGMQAAAILER